jgi:hypothetical protein
MQYSFCDINSQDGKKGVYSDKIHQDCSGCKVPHKEEYIKDNFSTSWKYIMDKCKL